MTPPVPETHTPPRQIRIGARWLDFAKAASTVGVTRAAIVNEFIAWYLREPGAKLPKRPDREDWTSGT